MRSEKNDGCFWSTIGVMVDWKNTIEFDQTITPIELKSGRMYMHGAACIVSAAHFTDYYAVHFSFSEVLTQSPAWRQGGCYEFFDPRDGVAV